MPEEPQINDSGDPGEGATDTLHPQQLFLLTRTSTFPRYPLPSTQLNPGPSTPRPNSMKAHITADTTRGRFEGPREPSTPSLFSFPSVYISHHWFQTPAAAHFLSRASLGESALGGELSRTIGISPCCGVCSTVLLNAYVGCPCLNKPSKKKKHAPNSKRVLLVCF